MPLKILLQEKNTQTGGANVNINIENRIFLDDKQTNN